VVAPAVAAALLAGTPMVGVDGSEPVSE